MYELLLLAVQVCVTVACMDFYLTRTIMCGSFGLKITVSRTDLRVRGPGIMLIRMMFSELPLLNHKFDFKSSGILQCFLGMFSFGP